MDPKKPGLSYRDAGVNIDAADEALRSVKDIVKKTFTPGVLRDIGTFGAMFQLDLSNYAEPVSVSSVDGVGTKLKIAFALNKHDTVGIDLVSHCVNDILVQGARPLFFLDYLAFGRLEPKIAVDVITGLSNGCRYAGCALIGGETAGVEAAVAAGCEAADGCLIDSFVAPNVHPDVFVALGRTAPVSPDGALGILESFNVATLIVAADAAAKAAPVQLLELRLAMALGGKAFCTLTGDVGAVQAAVAAGRQVIAEAGVLVNAVVISRPHPDVYREVI